MVLHNKKKHIYTSKDQCNDAVAVLIHKMQSEDWLAVSRWTTLTLTFLFHLGFLDKMGDGT